MIYMIEPDNNITTFATAKEAKAAMSGEYEQFASDKELAKLAANWPATRLAEIWNSLPGVKPVKKFKDRTTGANRVWEALRSQQPAATPDVPPQAAPVATKKAKRAAKPAAAKKASAPRAESKGAKILEMIRRPEGATLAAIMEATGWQPHSVRGFISGTLGKKMGLKIESAKNEAGGRTYRIIE